jgi:hypothetical protein
MQPKEDTKPARSSTRPIYLTVCPASDVRSINLAVVAAVSFDVGRGDGSVVSNSREPTLSSIEPSPMSAFGT